MIAIDPDILYQTSGDGLTVMHGKMEINMDHFEFESKFFQIICAIMHM